MTTVCKGASLKGCGTLADDFLHTRNTGLLKAW